MRPISSILLPALALLLPVWAQDKPCTGYDDQGKYYDLNSLQGSKDYQTSTLGGHKLLLNVCKHAVSETIGIPHPVNIAGFVHLDHTDFSLGAPNSTLVFRGGGPIITHTGGSSCKDGSHTASTVVQFTCDMSVYGAGTPEVISQFPEQDDEACVFNINWRTHYACPTHEPAGRMGLIPIFFVTLLVLFMAYLVIGTLYNHFALNLRGGDQIPKFNLPFLYASSQWAIESAVHAIESLFTKSRSSGQGLNSYSHQWSAAGGPSPSARVPQRTAGFARGGDPHRAFTLDEEEAMLNGPDDFSDDAEDAVVVADVVQPPPQVQAPAQNRAPQPVQQNLGSLPAQPQQGSGAPVVAAPAPAPVPAPTPATQDQATKTGP